MQPKPMSVKKRKEDTGREQKKVYRGAGGGWGRICSCDRANFNLVLPASRCAIAIQIAARQRQQQSSTWTRTRTRSRSAIDAINCAALASLLPLLLLLMLLLRRGLGQNVPGAFQLMLRRLCNRVWHLALMARADSVQWCERERRQRNEKEEKREGYKATTVG